MCPGLAPGEPPKLTSPLTVFYCYSHRDEDLRNELHKHLKLFERQGLIRSWHDRRIGPGQEWATEIDEKLNRAEIILLLVSADFLDSDYCYEIEMRRALERHALGDARVIPIILRDVAWQGAPFGKLQALPTDAMAITSWINRDQAFANVAKGIRTVIADYVPATAPEIVSPTILLKVGDSELAEIAQTLRAARTERSAAKCRALLKKAIDLCKSWEQSADNIRALILRAQTLAELAAEEDHPGNRSLHRKESLEILARQLQHGTEPSVAEAYAALAVDCFQDVFNDLNDEDRTRLLRNARNYLNDALDGQNPPDIAAALLSRKSSVLRHLSSNSVSLQARRDLLGESLRCATRAVTTQRTIPTVLEVALSEWAMARFEHTDEQYAERLRTAEAHLQDKLLEGFEVAQLSLARLYRMTFRPWDACLTFSRLLNRIDNLRRLLRDASIYGEAAVQLWYSNYPETVVKQHLSEAKTLLEAASAAGYRNARMITTLAFVSAFLGDASDGKTALTEIYTPDREISWDEVCRILTDKSSLNTVSSELVLEGFALGIDQSAVWTRLGTFALQFLNNEELAETLYKAATRLNPHDAIAHTNLARFLVKKGDAHSLQMAERELQKAQNFSDRRFTWWRAVLADLQEKRAGKGTNERSSRQIDKVPPPSPFRNMDQIKHRFHIAKKLTGAQQRGYELEQLVCEVAKLTFGTAAPPYRVLRTEGAISQIDGYFEHRGQKYRVECKWLNEAADHNHIVLFSDKLDVVGISGLLLSMAGFTSSAVQRAKELRAAKAILLMDGDEAEMILNGRLTFDELMTRKRLHFDKFSDPYHRIAFVPEAS